MYFKSKKFSFLLLGFSSFVCSRVFFLLLNDPEGPNLLIVLALAGIMFAISLSVYIFNASISELRRLLLGVCTQVMAVILLYIFLG